MAKRLKLKKIDTSKVGMQQPDAFTGLPKLEGSGETELTRAKINLPPLTEATAAKTGKIIRRKSKTPSTETNIIDERAMTKEKVREMMEKERLKNAKKRYRLIKGIK